MLIPLAVLSLAIVIPVSSRQGEFRTEYEAGGHGWSYDNVSWPGICSTGRSQSPINIDVGENVNVGNGIFNTKQLKRDILAHITNNGHSVSVHFPEDDVVLTSTYFQGEYKLDNVHFHWGSEHTLNGVRYPMEIHLVFFDRSLGNVTEALKSNHRVIVVGVLVEEIAGICSRTPLTTIASHMDQIRRYNTEVGVPLAFPIVVDDFLPKFSVTATYSGSLTTPDCNEGVQWFVILNRLQVCAEDIKSIKTLYGENGQLLKSTYRPVQPLNGRQVSFTL